SLRETVEDHSSFVRGNPDPRVDDVESQLARRFSPDCQARVQLHAKRDRAALREFQRVPNQIDENLPQTLRVPNQPQGDTGQNLKGELQATILRRRSHDLDYFL